METKSSREERSISVDSPWLQRFKISTRDVGSILNLGGTSGVATGWTGVNMSTPVFPEVDFLISRNPLKKSLGGGVIFIHSEHLGVPLWSLRRRIDVILIHDKIVSMAMTND